MTLRRCDGDAAKWLRKPAGPHLPASRAKVEQAAN
jgi:hypothetical protein